MKAARFVLVAHSLGGAISAFFTARYPQRVEKLVIIGSAVRFHLKWTGRALLALPAWLLGVAQRFVPRARLYPPAHQVMVERPDAVNRAMERFLGPALWLDCGDEVLWHAHQLSHARPSGEPLRAGSNRVTALPSCCRTFRKR